MDVALSLIGAERVDELRELWLALHRHHREVSELQPLVEDDELSWTRRRRDYPDWLDGGEAFVALAEDAGRPVGYAVVRCATGPTTPGRWGSRWAELYSLSVLPEDRSAGVGTAVLDFVDAELARLGILDMSVAVMVGNDDAQRLYEGRGFRAAEVMLYRFAPGPQAD